MEAETARAHLLNSVFVLLLTALGGCVVDAAARSSPFGFSTRLALTIEMLLFLVPSFEGDGAFDAVRGT